MLLTAAQRTAFFEEDAHMGIPNMTVIQLQAEGLDGIEDLADFDKETIKYSASNLRCPAGRIADPKVPRFRHHPFYLGPSPDTD
jgi:hypothetical protein